MRDSRMRQLNNAPEKPKATAEQKQARVLVAKTLLRWTLYAVGVVAYGAIALLWFIFAVIAQPFTENER